MARTTSNTTKKTKAARKARTATNDPRQQASTEEKIKEAARKLFTQKGFAATRTRDIADEAGINLALLNYYFRSKQKLFDIIMMENFRQFIKGISFNFFAQDIPLEQRLGKVATMYIDFLTQNPDLPMFILNELRNNPSQLAISIDHEIGDTRAQFFAQLQQAEAAGVIGINPIHLIANIVGLTVFPFVARPILQKVGSLDDTQFHELMQQRKELIPLWLKSMIQPQTAQPSQSSGTPQTSPTAQTTETPQTAQPSQTSATSQTSQTPETPQTPQTPETPETPETFQTSQSPGTPQTPPATQKPRSPQPPK